MEGVRVQRGFRECLFYRSGSWAIGVFTDIVQ
jgi:hypothetical protein